MKPIYDARLVDGIWGDPGICIDLKFQRRALLFDIGDVRSLSTRVPLRVSDIFVRPPPGAAGGLPNQLERRV
jgi:ribonuclease Z